MRKYIIIVALLLLLLPGAQAQERQISITVYNNDLGVVKDIRSLDLPRGISLVNYQDVAASIDPTSVHFKSLTTPDKVAILEQNYEFDLVNSDKIAERYLDRIVTIQLKDKEEVSGKLLSHEAGNLVLQTDTGAVKVISASQIVQVNFPKLPEGLITRPTLVWSIHNEKPGNHQTEVSYLASRISWHAEYVAVTKNNDRQLELSAWVSIDNRCGAAFPEATLKLIAGEVNRAIAPRPFRAGKAYAMEALDMAAPQFEEKSFFEYHMYTLNQKSTLLNNQIKQISLFPTTAVAIEKIYTYEAAKSAEDVRVNLKFKNSKESGLGMPLPAGKVRVYQEDPADKSLEFIGEDMIVHTAKDENVRLYLGNAFDITPERTMLKKTPTGKNSHEEVWQVKIRNHKDAPVTVQVIENFYGFWKIAKSSHEYKQPDSRTVVFNLPIEKDAEAVLEYTITFTIK
ncbi:MAG: DUF4139 domain-containing protein [Candidatus Zhuqueibacterota bacterium]